MMQLPEEAKKMMMNQFDSQATEMIQQNKEELISKRGKRGDDYRTIYTRPVPLL